jgi:DnaJ-class molecular chaperone
MEHDWSFEAVRPCRACGGSGKPPERPAVPGGDYSNFTRPAECPTCEGKQFERRRFTVAELKDLLAL